MHDASRVQRGQRLCDRCADRGDLTWLEASPSGDQLGETATDGKIQQHGHRPIRQRMSLVESNDVRVVDLGQDGRLTGCEFHELPHMEAVGGGDLDRDRQPGLDAHAGPDNARRTMADDLVEDHPGDDGCRLLRVHASMVPGLAPGPFEFSTGRGAGPRSNPQHSAVNSTVQGHRSVESPTLKRLLAVRWGLRRG